MTLPNYYPTYTLTIPSTGKKISVRPFLVKDERQLLMALHGEEGDIIDVTRQVVRNCIIDDIDIDKLPFFDLDYLFIALRAKSVGEVINIRYTCHNEVDGHVCNASFPAAIDVSSVTVRKDDEISNEIILPQQMKVKLKYPTYAEYKRIADNDNIIDKKVHLIALCIDQVIDKQKVLTSKDYTPQELVQWIMGFTNEIFAKFEVWVDNFPTFNVNAEAKCTKCGFDHKLEFTDYESFFQSH